MFFNEHSPPHCHAKYGEYKIIVDLIWVTEVRYVSDYKIMLIFNDGLQSIV